MKNDAVGFCFGKSNAGKEEKEKRADHQFAFQRVFLISGELGKRLSRLFEILGRAYRSPTISLMVRHGLSTLLLALSQPQDQRAEVSELQPRGRP